MSAVRSKPRLHARRGLPVPVRDEVVWVAARYRVVAFEVTIRDHMRVVPLEERYLKRAHQKGFWEKDRGLRMLGVLGGAIRAGVSGVF